MLRPVVDTRGRRDHVRVPVGHFVESAAPRDALLAFERLHAGIHEIEIIPGAIAKQFLAHALPKILQNHHGKPG